MFTSLIPFEYTNSCTCTDYDIDTETEATDCYGYCWEDTIENFTEITKHLFDSNKTMWWRIGDLRLWNGNYSGFVYADKPKDLLEGMSVRSEWIMRGFIEPDKITYSLSHHDAPMGSSSVVTMVNEVDRENYGLY